MELDGLLTFEQLGVLLGQLCIRGDLRWRRREVGANRPEAAPVGNVVDAVRDPVGSDVLVRAHLPDGAGVLYSSREALANLVQLRPRRSEVRPGYYIALTFR